MRQKEISRKRLLIMTSCIGAVTGALLRMVTTSGSAWLYILTAGFLIGLVTTTLIVWLFILFLELFQNNYWPYKQSRSRNRLKRATAITLGVAIVAGYMALIYAVTRGLYPEMIIVTLFCLLLLFLAARLALSRSPSPHESTLVHLLLTLLIASWAGLISLIGGIFGLSLAVSVILLDPLLQLLTDYWLLSGIVYGAILGAVAGTRL